MGYSYLIKGYAVMRAMILAAGRGERMGALTQTIPKPLIKIAGQYLIEYSLRALAKIKINEVVINISYRGDQIKDALGNGERYGLTIHYSEEKEVLETGGGILQALPLLGKDPFIVISSDIISDYALERLPLEPAELAHLVLVDNPVFHPRGDFCLFGRRIYYGKGHTLTFGNIGVYRPELFADCKPGHFRLSEVLKVQIARQQISGEHYSGFWHNIGTAEQVEILLDQSASTLASLAAFSDSHL
jgi:MurNAc alpha-1-phosphate uridylyltransferase